MWKIGSFLIFLSTSTAIYAHGISDAAKQSMIEGGYLQYAKLGALHMLTGYDHLLFLFGVMFFLTKFKDILKFITAFTLGHCITLIAATFMGINANYYLVDAVIALTVIYKGYDNIDGFRRFLHMKPPNLLVLVFVFGLIHGFGLSTRLQQLPLGDQGLLLKILSFNVGVEVGQVIALTVMLFVLASWRKRPSFQRLSLAANGGLMIAGGLLFLMQMHGYIHETSADELAFSKDAHRHAHLDMDRRPDDQASPSPQAPEAHPLGEAFLISIPPQGSREYKFYMKKGAHMKYAWEGDQGTFYFDFHGEPTGAKSGVFESFKKDTADRDEGSFTASFSGTVGWYWKNKTSLPVIISLRAKGSHLIMNDANQEAIDEIIRKETFQRQMPPSGLRRPVDAD